MRAWFNREALARWILAAGLVVISVLKQWWTDSFSGTDTATLYAIAGAGEFVLAVLVVVPATARVGVALTGTVFAGFLVASLIALALWGEKAQCKCLGSSPVSEGVLLVVQGVVVLLAGWVARMKDRGETPTSV